MCVYDPTAAAHRQPQRWIRPFVAAAVCVLALAVPSRSAVAQATSDAPSPRRGKWAATVLALLDHSEKRCTGISTRLSTYWSRLDGSAERRQAALEHYVLHRATAELAAAREALDLAHGFLPGVGPDSHPEVAQVLEKRWEAENHLCNLVAQPAGPYAGFRRRIEETEAEIQENEAVLRSVLHLPKKRELLKTLRPYTGIIELAAGVAQQNLLREIASLRPPPPPPPTYQELMETWHARYQTRVRPTKLALNRYLDGRRRNDASIIHQSCKDLLASVIPLLDEEEVFRAPDPGVEAPLRSAYMAIRRFAGYCTSGRFKEADEGYHRMDRFLARATRVLAPYSLHP